ncbi:unnamed protein product [Calypogeia fissa]
MDRQLKLIVTVGAVVVGGIFGLSMVSSVAIRGVQMVAEAKKKATAPPCRVCSGKGFIPCQLCQGKSVIYWSPLYDPVVPRPCLCPTCDGNRVQRCLNCIGRGYA